MKKISYLVIFIFFQTQLSFAQLSEEDCKQASKEIELIFQDLRTNFEGVSIDEKDKIRSILAETLVPYMDFEAATRYTLKRDFKKLKKIKPKALREEILKGYEDALKKFALNAITNLVAREGEGILEKLQTKELKAKQCLKRDIILDIDQLRIIMQIKKNNGNFKAKNITVSIKSSGISVHTGKFLNLRYKQVIQNKDYTFKDAYKVF